MRRSAARDGGAQALRWQAKPPAPPCTLDRSRTRGGTGFSLSVLLRGRLGISAHVTSGAPPAKYKDEGALRLPIMMTMNGSSKGEQR